VAAYFDCLGTVLAMKKERSRERSCDALAALSSPRAVRFSSMKLATFPAETQISLLRVIQEREFERVGGSHPISANARIIAATNRNLEDAIVAGTFRLDLFYRLNVFPIELPSLRERKADIPALVEYFIKRHAMDAGKKIRMVDKKTAELFQSYAWPGNIRELQSVIERSVILCEGEILSVDPSWLSVASAKKLSAIL